MKNMSAQKKKLPKSKVKKTDKGKVLKDMPHWLPYIVFALTTLIFFWDVLWQNAFFWEDFIEYVFPVQTFAAVQSANGIVPFWNPFSFMGMPFLADLQVGFFYPLNRILTLFVSDNTLSPWAIEFVIIFHFFIAQIAMYYLMRYFKVSSYGAIISSISYSFSMLLVCHVIHPMIVYHLAWLPMILMYFFRAIEAGKLSQAIIAGIILGFVMLSGHPQILLYIVFLLGIVFVWLFVAKIKAKELSGMKLPMVIVAGALPVIIAVGIFLIQYLPTNELAGQSQRSEITYEKATEGSLQFKNVYTAIVPGIFGRVTGDKNTPATYYDKKTNGQVQAHFYWETAFYFGIVALVLGLFGLLRTYKTRIGSMMLFIALFGFLFALGGDGVIFDIMYNVPYFGTFRNPSRIMFYVVLAFSIFAGTGFDELWKRGKDDTFKWQFSLALVFPLLVSFLTLTGTLPDILNTPGNVIADISASGGVIFFFTLVIAAIAYMLSRTNFNPSFGGEILILIAFIDLFLAGANFNKGTKNPADVYAIQPQLKEMFVPKDANELFRVNTRVYKPVSFSAMQRNQGMISRIYQVEGYNPLVLKKAAIYAPDEKTSFDLSNVKYQVKVDVQKDSWNYVERNSYYPRARMVYSAIIKSENEVINFMKTAGLNFTDVVVLDTKPNIVLSGKSADSVEHNLKIKSYNSNEFTVETNSVEAGILCLSEIWYPDWNAYVDGNPVEVYCAYNSFRAVEVPAGHHIIGMKYESSAYASGSLISFLTLLTSIVGYFIAAKYEKKHIESESNEE
jgi:hypothetical protein